MSLEQCTPDSLRTVNGLIYGGQSDEKNPNGAWVATFVSHNAADHFVRYAVENAKTFTGYRSE
jgi:hypothetical protein